MKLLLHSWWNVKQELWLRSGSPHATHLRILCYWITDQLLPGYNFPLPGTCWLWLSHFEIAGQFMFFPTTIPCGWYSQRETWTIPSCICSDVFSSSNLSEIYTEKKLCKALHCSLTLQETSDILKVRSDLKFCVKFFWVKFSLISKQILCWIKKDCVLWASCG